MCSSRCGYDGESAVPLFGKLSANGGGKPAEADDFVFYRIGFTLVGQRSSAAVDLRTAMESGNAIIMHLSGTFAAVGIVAAGVAMMMGRQSIAKWAFAGAMVSGLAFAIVKTMWGNMGLEASGVSSFTQ